MPSDQALRDYLKGTAGHRFEWQTITNANEPPHRRWKARVSVEEGSLGRGSGVILEGHTEEEALARAISYVIDDFERRKEGYVMRALVPLP
jgi:hypothetical protein